MISRYITLGPGNIWIFPNLKEDACPVWIWSNWEYHLWFVFYEIRFENIEWWLVSICDLNMNNLLPNMDTEFNILTILFVLYSQTLLKHSILVSTQFTHLDLPSWFKIGVSAADSVSTETDQSRVIRAKGYIENSKNSEKIATNLKKM